MSLLLWKFLRIFENVLFSLWWCSLKWIFHEIILSVVSSTMVFLFVISVVVLFKINTVFVKIRDLQIRWFTGTKLIYPEGKYATNFCPVSYGLYLEGEPYVLHFFCSYWKVCLESYVFIAFVKLMKNNFIEFPLWSQWKRISLNHEDLVGGLFMTTSQSFCFNQ